jgi:uncharacterized protein with GYD domain
MAHYLVQASYTPESWAALVKNPQDRNEIVRPIIERLGGRLDQFYLAFGANDVVGIIELPDNVSAAALSLAVSSSGAMKSLQTTPLMTMKEGIEAMKKAGNVDYQPPG